jgi:hypothetical protein
MMMGKPCVAVPTSVGLRAKSGQDDVRGVHRMIAAALLAGGLALSVSVHPMQRSQGLIEGAIPNGRLVSDAPSTAGSTFRRARLADFSSIQLLDLVRLVEFSDQHPEVSTGALLRLIDEFGIRTVVRSFELLSSMGLVRPLVPNVPYGGGNYSSNEDGGDALNPLMIVLALLDGRGPSRGRGLFEALRYALTELVATVDRPPNSSVPSPAPTDVALTVVPSFLPPPSVSSLPMSDPPPDAVAADPLPVGDHFTPPQIQDAVTTKTDTSPTDSPAPPAVVVSGAAAETAAAGQPEPDPPTADPPKTESTSGSGSDDGSIGNTSSGSSSSSSGSSGSDDSGAGSAGSAGSGGAGGAGESGGGSPGGE